MTTNANTYITSAATGIEYFVDANGLATPALPYNEDWQEGPTCSLCDALGHGYPGAGPCPLEERGWEDAMRDREVESGLRAW